MTMEERQETSASLSDRTAVSELKQWAQRLPAEYATERIKERTREAIGTGVQCRGDAFGRNDVVVLRAAESEPLRIPVSALPCTVGRDPAADITLQGKTVSRWHCRFERESVFIRISDLGARNGTYLNGTRVDTEFLREGDSIAIGDLTLAVERR